MGRDPRIDQLLGHLTTLQEQHTKFKVQVTNFVEKLPPDSPERERMNELTGQLAVAIETACGELEKLGVSRREIDKAMKIQTPQTSSKKISILVVLAVLALVAGILLFLQLR